MRANLPRGASLGARLALALVTGAAVACGGPGASSPDPSAGPLATAEPERPRVVALGDSLTAGLGLLETQAYPAQLQARLDEHGYDVEVVNAGVSADTSAGGVRRLDWALEGNVRVLIVALGGNDALRGLSLDDLRQNLGVIVETAQSRGIAVLLAGMEAPPNFGEDYTTRFRQVYQDLALTYRVTFVPFLLDGVAGHPELNQADGIHPNAEGAFRIADTLWRVLQPMVDVAVAR